MGTISRTCFRWTSSWKSLLVVVPCVLLKEAGSTGQNTWRNCKQRFPATRPSKPSPIDRPVSSFFFFFFSFNTAFLSLLAISFLCLRSVCRKDALTIFIQHSLLPRYSLVPLSYQLKLYKSPQHTSKKIVQSLQGGLGPGVEGKRHKQGAVQYSRAQAGEDHDIMS